MRPTVLRLFGLRLFRMSSTCKVVHYDKKKAFKKVVFERLRTRFVADYHRSRAVMVLIYEHKVKYFFN